ncbi:MAG TPA: sulfite exporter TauE/SafE family protein [Pseudolabrys sp.]|jgi:uncharacterized membrane protein YfcA|nr:sulfite exporter TauE/SafE family protein [Pseudolabrys sp.]
MDHHTILILLGAGVLAGILSSIIGGAAVVSYPALLAAGLPPQIAVASNLFAVMPGTLIAAFADRTQLPPLNRAFAGLVFASITGAAAGAILLLFTPVRVFEVLVPLLLGFATLVFAYSGKLSAWLKSRAKARGHDITFNLTSLKMLLPVSFYGGYFGAGVGVLLLGVFTLATRGDYRSANVTKNFVTGLNSMTASTLFAVQGAVAWPQTLTMMAGCIAGGLLGSYIARLIPQWIMRIFVVAMGALLTAAFAWRYWF